MIARVAALLRRASRILVFTGAGISTASGIPDYRGPQGVWRTRTPVFFEDFMTSEAERVRYWTQKLEDRGNWGRAKPTAVHRAVVDLERAGKVLLVVTQNVDGLHRVAGTAPELLVEIHGTVGEVECMSCKARSDPEPHYDSFAATGLPPACPCGGLLKPATISFGQPLRAEDVEAAFDAAEQCDLVVALGSTLTVTPAADVPLHAARRGAPYVVINQGPTEHDRWATVRVEGDVETVFPPAVAAALEGGLGAVTTIEPSA